MDRLLKKRLALHLSTGLSILAIVAVGYSLDLKPDTADASSTAASAAPGDLKDLPDPSDPILSKQVPQQSDPQPASPAAHEVSDKVAAPDSDPEAETHDFHATAYCLKGPTASGVHTRPGVIAADPRLLPLGTIVRLKAGIYSGTYTVMDTGARIKGKRIDIYVPTYKQAVRFGRRRVKLQVVGHINHGEDPAVKRAIEAKL